MDVTTGAHFQFRNSKGRPDIRLLVILGLIVFTRDVKLFYLSGAQG